MLRWTLEILAKEAEKFGRSTMKEMGKPLAILVERLRARDSDQDKVLLTERRVKSLP
jgi:hypothetical protein